MQETHSPWLQPPVFSWTEAILRDRYVELLVKAEQAVDLLPLVEEEAFFLSLPQGKRLRVRGQELLPNGDLILQIKGLSLTEARRERGLTVASYPWAHTGSVIIAVSTQYNGALFRGRVPLSRLDWGGDTQNWNARLSYLGEDGHHSLWQAYFSSAYRVCLGSLYPFRTGQGEGEAIILSAVLSEFKTKRESMGAFLKGAQNLPNFWTLRASLGLVAAPSEAQLPTDMRSLGEGFYLKGSLYSSLQRCVLKLSQIFGGITFDNLLEKLGEEKFLVTQALKTWVADGILGESEGFYWQVAGVESRLSPLAKNLLVEVEARGAEGCALFAYGTLAQRETLLALYRVGLIAGYAPEEFFLSFAGLEILKEQLRAAAPNLNLSLGQIRDALGVSRKVAITLCESLRVQGIMERENEIWTWVVH